MIGNETKAIQVMNGGSDKPAIGFKKLDISPVKQLKAVG
jgi:hypothetical protein